MIMKILAAFVLALTVPGVVARLDGHQEANTNAMVLEESDNMVVKKDAEERGVSESSVSCYINNCDFYTLTPNAFDNYALRDECGAFAWATLPINVFDSNDIKSKYPRDDPDLGSPNKKCSPSGPGRGAGGIPGSDYENCNPLNNLLILQNPTVADLPNDDPRGGCFFFDFIESHYLGKGGGSGKGGPSPSPSPISRPPTTGSKKGKKRRSLIKDSSLIKGVSGTHRQGPRGSGRKRGRYLSKGGGLPSVSGGKVIINDIGLLDIEEGATIKLITAPDWGYTTISIDSSGDNGHWIASQQLSPGYLSDIGYVYGVEICLNGSGAVSFIDNTKCHKEEYY